MTIFNKALILGGAMTVMSAVAQANHVDERWYLAPMAGFVTSDFGQGDIDFGPSVYFGVGRALGERWNLEFSTAYSSLDTDSDDGGGDYDRFGMLGINAQYHFSRQPGLNPYLLAGMTATRIDFADANDYAPSAEFGAGFLLPLTERVAFRTELRYELNFQNGNDAAGDDTFYEWNLMAGLKIALGERTAHVVAPAPTPPPVIVVEEDVEVEVVEVERVAITRPVGLPSILFPLDSAQLTSNSKITLDDVARTMRDNPDMDVNIIGNADDTGPSDYNLKLSQRRCKSVQQYLIGKGIDADRLDITPQGEARPVAENSTAQGRQENRRVDLEVQ